MNTSLKKLLSVFVVLCTLTLNLPLPLAAQKTPAQTRQEMKALMEEVAQKLTPEEKNALVKLLKAGERLADIKALVARPGLYPKPLPIRSVLGTDAAINSFNASLKDLIMKREWVLVSDKTAGEVTEDMVRNAYRILENEVIPQFLYEGQTPFVPGSTTKSIVKNNLKQIEDAFNTQLRLAYPDSHCYIKDAASWGKALKNEAQNKVGKIANYRVYMLKNGKMTRISTLAKGLSRTSVALGVALFAVAAFEDNEAVAKVSQRLEENPALAFSLNEEELSAVEQNQTLKEAVNAILAEGGEMAALSDEEKAQVVQYVNQTDRLRKIQVTELQKELRNLAQ